MNDTQPSPAYHAGMRELQDRFDTRALADRLDERLGRRAFSAEDRAFIESRSLFFLATADASGQPDCLVQGRRRRLRARHRRRRAGLSQLRRQRHVPQPGQRAVNPAVGIAVHRLRAAEPAARQRPRTHRFDDPLLASFAGAQLVVRVRAERIFPNCPRYVHRMSVVEPSPYVPHAGQAAPVPKWKRMDDFRDVLARDDPARDA